MALVTTYHHPITTTRKQQEDIAVIQAQKQASDLSAIYDIPWFKLTKTLGICYLTKVRKTKAGINATYLSEAAIIKAANA
jgi:hypothetical protein